MFFRIMLSFLLKLLALKCSLELSLAKPNFLWITSWDFLYMYIKDI